ncbi:ABC transporter permease [Brachybacterium sp. GCM10030252]|uniref:ABC transporter permease n=1 Tax=Brachybacterium sp. GCM10030252 TaxID=3273380 RepID=UPI003620F125
MPGLATVRRLRRDAAVTATLTVLLALAVLCAVAAAGLMARLAGASTALLDQADAPHLAQMHAGELDAGAVDAFAAERPEVTAHRTQLLLGLDGSQLSFDGVGQDSSIQQNSLTVPSAESDLMLDLDGQAVTEVRPGTIWLPVMYRIEDGLRTGSEVTITGPDGFARDLEVAGFFRDSLMNTPLASSKRLLVSERDLAEIADRTGSTEYLISFWLQDPQTQVSAVRTAYQVADLPEDGPMVDRQAFMLFAVLGDGLVAAAVLGAALVVLAIALICVRLALATALARERREIGVLRALGIRRADLRRAYLLRYGTIALAATIIGLLGGITLGSALAADLTAYSGPTGGAAVLLAPVVAALAVLIVALAGVSLMLRRIRRIDPVEVLRGAASGAAGRSGPSRAHGLFGLLSLHSSPLPVPLLLGLRTLVRRAGSSFMLLTVFTLCTVLAAAPTGVASTLTSPGIVTAMGIGRFDVRIDVPLAGEVDSSMHERALAAVASDPRIEEYAARVSTRHLVEVEDGPPLNLPIESGDHTVLPVQYAEGRAPTADEEIALSLVALAETGASLGDTLTVRTAAGARPLRVVGAYQDVTQGGLTAKAQLPTAQEEVQWSVIATRLAPGADQEALIADLAAALPEATVGDVSMYHQQLLGGMAGGMTRAATAAAAVAAALAGLIAALVTRMVLAEDARQLDTQRALGIPRDVRRSPYLVRMLAALLLALPLGLLLSQLIAQGGLNVMIEAMTGGLATLGQGTSRITLHRAPVIVLVAIPLVLAVAVTVATRLATIERTTRRGPS